MKIILVLAVIAVAFILLLTLALCRAAAEGDRLADELYAQWLEDSGYGRTESESKAAL